MAVSLTDEHHFCDRTRLGHALNALSQFTKKLKKYIKENGVNPTLTFIKETLFSPWLTDKWFEE